MLDYTRAAGRKIRKDIDAIALGLSFATQALSVLYLLYILVNGNGNFAVKLSLFLISAFYLCFYTVATIYGAKKALKRNVLLIVQWSRRAVKLVNLGVIIYGFASMEHTSFSLLLITFTILSWALDVVIGVLSFVMEAWLQLLFAGIEADVEKITTPVTATKNFFKRIIGQEVPEKPAPTANKQLLEEMVQEEKEERKQRKLTEKELRKQKKEEKKAQKRAEKQTKKSTRNNPAPDLFDEVALSDEENPQ